MRRDHRKALDLIEQDMQRRNRVPKYVSAVLDTGRRFFTSTVPDRALAKITRGDVETFLAARVATGVAHSTPVREFGMLNVLFTILVNHEVIAESPTLGLKVREPTTPPQLFLSEGSIARLLEAALVESPGAARRRPRWTRALALRNRALHELLYGVGLRDSEVRAALVVDLNLGDGSLLVRAAKRGRWRRVPLPPSSIPHLTTYLHEARPLFLKGRADTGHLLVTKSGTRLSQSTSFGIVKLVAERAGLKAHPHAFRRALATHLIRAKVPVTVVQELLGHRSLATTAQYLTVERDDLRGAVALLDGAGDDEQPSSPT